MSTPASHLPVVSRIPERRRRRRAGLLAGRVAGWHRSAAALVLALTAWAVAAAAQSVQLPAAGGSPAGRYLVDLPPGGGRGAPLLLALHGAASSPEAMRAMTGLSEAANAAGVAVAYPASAGVVWNDGRSAVHGFAPLAERDDVAFLRAVVRDAVARFGVDGSAVSVVGLGSGGSMALQLGCQVPGLARALVAVNASLRDDQLKTCASEGLPSLLIIHGDGDPRQPWDGMDLTSEGVDARVLGVEATVADWAGRLGCRGAPAQQGSLTLAQHCPGARFAAAVRVAGEGGAWPRPSRPVTVAGTAEAALDASNLDASAISAAVAAGGPWQGLVPAKARLTGPAPGRSFDVYAPPSYDPSKPTPVVLMLHGRGDSGYGMAALSKMNAVADRNGFLVAYPESLGDSWNYYLGVPGVVPRSRVDDLAFFRRLVERLALDFNVDRKRLYIAGFSNGGFMSERAACGVSDEFAAFAVVSAEMLPEMVFNCDLVPTAPIVYIMGTDDNNVPWGGIVVQNQGRRRYATLPATVTIAFWTLRNACPFLPDQVTLPDGTDGQTRVLRVSYGPCALGRDVLFYAVQGGGHNWPGTTGLLPAAEAGNVTTAIDGSDVIWKFFAQYPLDAARNQPVVPPNQP